MKMGTRSVLYGVHQIFWHPLTVAAAWRRLYGAWPKWWEWVAICLHDVGYVGKSEMDSADGITHPELGARLTKKIVGLCSSKSRAEEAFRLSLYHSSHYARVAGQPVSRLYLPDKASILVEPEWLYLLRARLSGEIREYVARESEKVGFELTVRAWLSLYKEKIRAKVAEEGVKRLSV